MWAVSVACRIAADPYAADPAFEHSLRPVALGDEPALTRFVCLGVLAREDGPAHLLSRLMRHLL